MTEQLEPSRSLAEKREMLQNREILDGLPMDDVLDMANSVTDELADIGLVAFEQEAFEAAADLFDELATVWRNAIEVLPDDMLPYLQMVVEYWVKRGLEAQEQKAIQDEEGAITAESSKTQRRHSIISFKKIASDSDRPMLIPGRRSVRGTATRNSSFRRRDKKPGASHSERDSGIWKKLK